MLSTSKALFRKPSGGGGDTTDPSFAYVPLLLNTGSTNGQQNNTFLDSSTNNFTITRNGTPTQGSITPYWPNGQWSNYFNGSSDWLGASPNTVSVLNFGTNPYTIEFWFYGLVKAANQMILRAQNATGSLQIYIDTSGIINFGPQNSAVTITIPSANWNINTWNHIAFSRVGTGSNQLTVYVNGVSIASATDSFNYTITGIDIGAGTNFAGGYYLNGYVSNLRTVNGRAVYTGAFTPPTSPLTSTTGGTNPPTGTQCTLLTCQSNRFIDANTAVAAKTFTVNGTPQVQAFQPFSPTASYTTALYGGSGYFNGSTDYLTAASSNIVNFGTGDFTAEAWIYLDAVNTSIASIISNYNNGSNGGLGWYVNRSTSGGIQVYSGNSLVLNANSAITAKTWAHIAICRASGTTRFFVNGVVSTSVSDSSNYGVDNSATGFGGTPSGGGGTSPFPGLISNLRVVKGTAVYTGAFTPPTLAPLATTGPASAASYSSTTNVNTTFLTPASLLLNMTNAGIYDAAAQNDLTTVGDAKTDTTIYKWSPSSMKFDGSGDFIRMVDAPVFDLGSSDFTIEAWIYLSGSTGCIYSRESPAYDGIQWQVTSGTLSFQLSSNGGVYALALTAGSVSLGTWTYVAATRSGSGTNNIKTYSGTTPGATISAPITQGTFSGSIYTTSGMNPIVGARNTNGDNPFNGYIQDFRITRGVGRTISTVPSAAFPTR